MKISNDVELFKTLELYKKTLFSEFDLN